MRSCNLWFLGYDLCSGNLYLSSCTKQNFANCMVPSFGEPWIYHWVVVLDIRSNLKPPMKPPNSRVVHIVFYRNNYISKYSLIVLLHIHLQWHTNLHSLYCLATLIENFLSKVNESTNKNRWINIGEAYWTFFYHTTERTKTELSNRTQRNFEKLCIPKNWT